MRRRDVPGALQMWGIEPAKVTRVRAVFKIRSAQGAFCLKPTGESEKHLVFFDSVLRYVESRGFELAAAYIPTLEGKPLAAYAGENLILTPWLEGREISYQKPREMVAAAELLGRFHAAAQGYAPEPGVKVKNKLNKWPDKLARQAGDIQYYIDLARQEQNRFDRLFLRHAEWIYGHTIEAFRLLRDSSYYQLVEAGRETVQICHGDPSKRNFIQTNDGHLHMIDFESMKVDLPVVDLWRLARRILSRDQWDLRLLNEVLAGYSTGRPLSAEEYELLGIFLTFPEKVWRTLHDFYGKRGQSGWSEEKLLKKLRMLLAQSAQMDRFLDAYRREYM